MKKYPEKIARYLDRLYSPGNRRWACHAKSPDDLSRWQFKARPVLCSLLGLNLIQEQSAGHIPSVSQDEAEDCHDFTRRRCLIETEPEVRVPFWLLKPKRGGIYPLAITPHGHDLIGADTCAGVAHDSEHAKKIKEEERDVAVQAVRRGFIAIAPAVRGLAEGYVTNLFGRFNGKDCTSHFMHGLLAGRTSIGERVWDMQCIINWANGLEDVQEHGILMMGNSGGGVLTTYCAACDPRVDIAVAGCSYSPFVGLNGKIQHHDCNTVPGIMAFGEFWDVAGLIAPRYFLAVHGRRDQLKAVEEVDRAVAELRRIYASAGVSENFDQCYGEEGHRFYKNLMWPFVDKAMKELCNSNIKK